MGCGGGTARKVKSDDNFSFHGVMGTQTPGSLSSKAAPKKDAPSFKAYQAPTKDGEFCLRRANILGKMSGLAYAGGHDWASDKPGEGVFSRGVAGLSAWCKFRTGTLEGVQNELGVALLDATHNRTWDDGQGNLTDGLLCYSSSFVHSQGMIMVRPAQREVIVVLRGTEVTKLRDLMTDILAFPTTRNAPSDDAGYVHAFMYKAWYVMEHVVVQVMRSLMQSGNYDKVWVTGHSLGGALAIFCALALAEQIPDISLEVYTYGGAITGTQDFKEYFDRKVTLFRVVNDKDIVPNLGTQLGYRHSGQTVVINENGCWITSDVDEIQCDDEGGWFEFASDHAVPAYLKLLDFHQAKSDMAQMRGWSNTKSLEEAWSSYMCSDDMLQKHTALSVQEDGNIALVRIRPPDATKMKEVLCRKCGLSAEEVDLLESQMLWLRWWYYVETIDWQIFVIAVYMLFYSPDVREKKWAQYLAKLRQGFHKWDLDSDEFLTWEEFSALCQHELLAPNTSQDDRAAALEEIKVQFQKIDVNHDSKLSFAEYALWRRMGEFECLFSGTWFRKQQLRERGRSKTL